MSAILVSLLPLLVLSWSLAAAKPPLISKAVYSPLGNDHDIWFVNISVGTPPQSLAVQIDTDVNGVAYPCWVNSSSLSGSSDLLIYDTSCTDCRTQRTFNHSSSSTFQRVACADPVCGGTHQSSLCLPCANVSSFCLVRDGYVDGSFVAGTVVKDRLSFLGLDAMWSFGLVTNESKGFLPKPFSGIWGLSFAPESCWWQNSAIFALLNASQLPHSLSLCLLERDGFLMLGEDFAKSKVPYGWTPLLNETFWAFTIDSIALGEQVLNLSTHALNEYESIFDSGWQGFGLNEETYNATLAEIHRLCLQQDIPYLCNGSVLKHHEPLSKEQLDLYPNVTFTLRGGLRVLVTPHMYMLQSKAHPGTYEWGLPPAGRDVGTTFGSEMLKSYRVALDVTGQRLGVAPGKYCSYPS